MASPAAYKLACLEVWGGNGVVAREVALPGLAGWVYSRPAAGSAAGGDVYYLSVCGQGALTRVTLADISGHGQEASQAAECLRDLVRGHIDTFDQANLLHDLNQSFQRQCLREVRFASVILLGVYGAPGLPESGRMVFSNAGQPPPLWYRAEESIWGFLKLPQPQAAGGVADLPLGVIADSPYNQNILQLQPNDFLLVYSDGILEARNRQGELLYEEGLLHLAATLPLDSPAAIGQALLEAVAQFRSGAPAQDDETLLVLKRLAT